VEDAGATPNKIGAYPVQNIDDCKSKIAEYLKNSDFEINVEELDECILQLISCWCQAGVQPDAIALTLKPISLRIKILNYLRKNNVSSIDEILISEIEKRVLGGDLISKACDDELSTRRTSRIRSTRKI
jgi:hypothetical protein